MSATALPSARKNLLAPPANPDTPVFVGDQRAKARALLASKIVEQHVMAVMQLVNKDPSLALGTVPMTLTNGGVARVEELDFAFACLMHDVTPGVMFAVTAGFPVDTPNGAGRHTAEPKPTSVSCWRSAAIRTAPRR